MSNALLLVDLGSAANPKAVADLISFT